MDLEKNNAGPMQALFALISLITAAALCFHRAIGFPGGMDFLWDYSFLSLLKSPLFYAASIAVFALCNLLAFVGKKYLPAAVKLVGCEPPKKRLWVYFAAAFGALLLSSLTAFLIFYPATGMVDTQYILICGTQMYKQHPYWYCLLYGELFRLAQSLFADSYKQYAFVALFQLVLMDALLAAAAAHVRKISGIKQYVFFVLYLALLPIISLYSITLVKDALFSVATLWLCIWVYSVVNSRGDKPELLFTLIVFFALCATRNNGKYILFLLLIILLFIYKRRRLIFVCLASLVIALAACALPGKILDKSAPQVELYQETVGIPIQQLAAVYTCGGELDEADMEYLDGLFDLSQLKQVFDPYDVDVIKWSGVLDNEALSRDTGAFWRGYLRIAAKNPKLIIKEWLLASYGYWDGDNFANYVQSVMFSIDFRSGIENRSLLPEGITAALRGVYYRFARFFCGGVCLLALLCFSLLLIKTKRQGLILLCLPLLINTLSLFASAPIAMGYRYILPYAYAAPFLAAALLSPEQNNEMAG